MERIDPLDTRPSITIEHVHRYTIAAALSSGRVLDVSCGLGYAAPIFASKKTVTHYEGVDIEAAVIAQARGRYGAANRPDCSIAFTQGSIYELPYSDASFDTVVSLETLEHVDRPEDALKELSRVVSNTGIVIASVPTKAYDDLCDSVFGPNVFHLSSFTRERLTQLLTTSLPYHRLFVVAVALGTKVHPVSNNNDVKIGAEIAPAKESIEFGSYLAVGTKSPNVNLDQLGARVPNWQYMMNFVEFEAEISNGLKKTIHKMQEIIDDRDRSIRAYQEEVARKNEFIKQIEQALAERWAIIEEYDRKLAELKLLISEPT